MQLRRERVAAPGLLHVRVELLLPRSSSCSRGLGRVEPCLRAPLQDVVHLDVVDAGWCHSARCILLDDLPFRKRIGIGLVWCLLLLRRGGANLRTVPPCFPVRERIRGARICGSARATHHHQQGKQREHPRRKHAGYTKCRCTGRWFRLSHAGTPGSIRNLSRRRVRFQTLGHIGRYCRPLPTSTSHALPTTCD